MGYVRNNNAHRIAVARPGEVPLRLSAGAVAEADGELLDRLVATRGVETVGKSDYDTAVAGRDVEAETVVGKQQAGESYKDPITVANEELAAGGGLTTADTPSHDGGSAISNPPIDPRTGEEKEPRSASEAAHFHNIKETAAAAGAPLEDVVGVGQVAPETSPIVGVGSSPDDIPGSVPSAPEGEPERISGDYEDHTNAELKAEADARGVDVEGRTKADYVSALEAHDEDATAPAEPDNGGSE